MLKSRLVRMRSPVQIWLAAPESRVSKEIRDFLCMLECVQPGSSVWSSPASSFFYNGAFGEFVCVYVIPSIAASFGVCLGTVNGSCRVVRWGIDRGKFQGTVSDVDDVVPCTAGSKNAISFAEFDLCVQAVFIVAHANQSNTGFHANELIRVFVNFQTNISAR